MIRDWQNLLKNKLEEAIENNLPQNLKIPVEIPVTIENYNLRHALGAYLIVYKGSTFTHKDLKTIIAQNRDLEFGIIIAARYRTDFTPEDYLDFAIKSLSGIETDSKRTDRKIYCSNDEWIKEENGIWWYAATMIVPAEFFEGVG
ncbi:MAG: Gp37 family protein [Melioribacteraceae bacterium]